MVRHLRTKVWTSEDESACGHELSLIETSEGLSVRPAL